MFLFTSIYTLFEKKVIYYSLSSPLFFFEKSSVVCIAKRIKLSWKDVKTGSTYSRVHISSDEVFSKILKKSSIVQKKWYLIWKPLVFLIRWSKFFIFFWKKKFKMAAYKKCHFPAPPILNIFLWKFHGLVLGLVELIDAKGIDMAQPIWLWGCPA